MDVKEETHAEFEYDRNIRYICYSLLKDVRFNGEVVVPRIISENKHELSRYEKPENVFEVEKLPGEDLNFFLRDKNITLRSKLEVLLHVTRQLEAINQAGYVLFDRWGGNIRVLKWGDEGISTRQVDIEDMYDQKADCVYSLREASMSDSMVDKYTMWGINLWSSAVNSLANQGVKAANIHENTSVSRILARCGGNKPGQPVKNRTLDQFQKALEKSLKSLEQTEQK